jgi:periplasmic protein TonB
MFRESLLETSGATLAQRSWATLMSFSLETTAIALLLIVPLFITQAVPMFQPLAPPRMTSLTPEQIRDAMKLLVGPAGDSSDDVFRAPGQIPKGIVIAKDNRPRGVPVDVCGSDCVYDPTARMATEAMPTVISQLLKPDGQSVHPAVLKLAALPPVRISHMDPGMLISSVEPKYPPLARATRVQGEVLLSAMIGKDGRIENLQVIGGHPMLVRAALDAVRQWRYRPTMLNGQPVEVDTTIAVKFSLRQD